MNLRGQLYARLDTGFVGLDSAAPPPHRQYTDEENSNSTTIVVNIWYAW